jgi:hypothetical protein
MTFADMVNEVIAFRFNSTQDIYVKRWLNLREQEIWSAAEWPWKKMIGVQLTIDQNDNYLDLPGTVRRVENVYDESGAPLAWFPPDEFARRNRGNTVPGHPAEYTLSGNQIQVAPVADNNYGFTIDYERGIWHFNQAGVRIDGPMTEDTDYPAWDQAYYWILVPGAMATGLRMENDPTFQPLENEFVAILDVMREDLMPPSHASTLQYGKDNLGGY